MRSIVLTIGACFALFLQSQAVIIYVNGAASGANDGTSWTNAFTNLSTALDEATNNTSTVDTIYVAEGIYIPDIDPGAGAPMYRCPPQIALFGGFPGSGNPTFNDRDFLAHPTVLEGDALGNDDGTTNTRSDNAVRLLSFDTFGRLDGFLVRNGGNNQGNVGAGLAVGGATSRGAVVANCIFENNWVTSQGALAGDAGAIRAAAVNPTDQYDIRNVIFRNNKAKIGGALIYSGSIKMNNLVFIGNEAELGSGIAIGGTSNGAGTGTLIQGVFYNNYTFGGTNQGDCSGVIGRMNPGRGDFTVWNSTFKNNAADSVSVVYGGIPLNFNVTTIFHNCLFDEGNTLPAFAAYQSDSVVLNNCVAAFTEGWMANGTVTSPDNGKIALTNWQEGQSISYSEEDQNLGIFVLDCDAPGHNGGDNSLLPSSVANGDDIRGNARIQGGTVDVGAYETAAFDTPDIQQSGSDLEVNNGPFDNYQWLLNGMPISGATSPTYTPTQNGDYALVASIDDACGNDTSNVVPVVVIGVEELAQNAVRLWPNPANEFLQIESEQTVQRVVVHDLSGRQITLPVVASKRIDVGHLPRGVYFVDVYVDHAISTHRIVKL
ncbi:MAG: T9SS type A sorting domain-containing protein [Salibacteraceae bacterium]